jgi:response regulator RpfG family c-di-GMP phosphodiesterase
MSIPATQAADTQPCKILIIDDDTDDVEILADVFKQQVWMLCTTYTLPCRPLST